MYILAIGRDAGGLLQPFREASGAEPRPSAATLAVTALEELSRHESGPLASAALVALPSANTAQPECGRHWASVLRRAVDPRLVGLLEHPQKGRRLGEAN
jgi:hypothetical protein